VRYEVWLMNSNLTGYGQLTSRGQPSNSIHES
jgi:hypothetical protein